MASTAKREANMWLSVKMDERLAKMLGKRTQARIDRIDDPEQRERLRREMLQREFAQIAPSRREEMFDEIVNGMPRRLRRALGDRSYSQAGRHMAVPKGRRG